MPTVGDPTTESAGLLMSAAGLAASALLAACFWRLALRRFGRER